ncbi:hypothetical protein BDK51DRAFT_25876 [Blyttiomyces helicus]|uniref:Uncharacterized protein n=1 Tax=Blyttiomyces helicus TaxID=388810 RepID=A0A4P9WLI3_9FUNG|nr:hypothetical protein BDK51DRAFT_25876 [Blyttiomyces helicus]|eukprot:RKO93891.1 hypothetical protein BDK51DRAFT_25876 [Blyttiomyces helicus]
MYFLPDKDEAEADLPQSCYGGNDVFMCFFRHAGAVKEIEPFVVTIFAGALIVSHAVMDFGLRGIRVVTRRGMMVFMLRTFVFVLSPVFEFSPVLEFSSTGAFPTSASNIFWPDAYPKA